MTTKILVIGAGELGTAVLTSLHDLLPPSTTLSILVRTPTSPSSLQKLKFFKSHSIETLFVDIEAINRTGLTNHFSPFALIISCLGYTNSSSKLQLKIAEAVLAAHVPRFVPWQFGVDYDAIGRGSAQDLFDEQCDVRDLLRGGENKGTEWIIISTGIFMSFLFGEFWGVVGREKAGEGNGWCVKALGSWENKITVTTPEDIGILTAKIVSLDYAKLADIVEEVTGSKVRREIWELPTVKKEWAADKDSGLKKYRVVFTEGVGCSWDMDKTFNAKRGIKVEDVRTWAGKHL
ncbi:hypothetical protein NHQ30_009973 [Ciborinia camelliae]|nr:hypothetical protein NHQ30_009973 [Ciborinia camelliae]